MISPRVPWRRLLGAWLGLVFVGQVLLHLPVGVAAPPPIDVAVRYRLEAELHPRTRRIEGRGTLTWRNPSDTAAVDAIWLHLYLNAFRDERSTFLQEAQGSRRGDGFKPEHAGHIDLRAFRRVSTGADLLPRATFEAPDDGNAYDRTVLRIPLDAPLGPGEEAEFEMAWDSRLPRVRARTGAALGETFFLVAQWYPKPGVFEALPGPDGVPTWQWTCPQFHAHSEFYADWAAFDVTLRAPGAFEGRIGATGTQQGEARRGDDGTVEVRFAAEPVHDFAWVAGEHFLVRTFTFAGGAGVFPEEQRRMARILGLLPGDLDLPPVEVTLLLQPEHADQEQRHRVAVENALSLMGLWFGPYPYPTLTVVDPDHRGSRAGGMEYPTFITAGTRLEPGDRELTPEGVVVHEFGHQVFYGLLASNEFAHAWLDEGFTTYATGRVLMHAYPAPARPARYLGLPYDGEPLLPFPGLVGGVRRLLPSAASLFDDDLRVPLGGVARWLGTDALPDSVSLWPEATELGPITFLRDMPPLTHADALPHSVAEGERLRDASLPFVDPIAGRKGWEYLDRTSYGVNSYFRPANALRTLERLLGEETMLRLLRRYVAEWSFRHPQPQDFFDVATEVAAAEGHGDIAWFFDEIFVQGLPVAYAVAPIETRPLPAPRPEELAEGQTAPPEAVVSRIVVQRLGEARLPVEVALRFEDGTTRLLRWRRDDTLEALDGGPVPPAATPARGRQARWVRMDIVAPTAVELVQVDPHERLALERNRLDDGYRATAAPAAAWHVALRALGQVEMTTTFYGGL
jgi:hypothetical protein